MSFDTFCNICFIKKDIIKLCLKENELIFNILISFTSCQDTLNGIIYLCISCCNKLEEYDKFRELFLTNFVRFRYLYNEHKKHLEINNAPDIETKLKAFIDVNVERASGTPLIENYEVAHALRNNTTCNVDIAQESDDVIIKTDLDELLNKKGLIHRDTCFIQENNISENEPQIYQVKCENDVFDEDQENNGDTTYVKDEPNPDQFEESRYQPVSDTVANVIPYESADDDISDVSFNSEDYVTDDSSDEEGSADNENKTTSNTVCNVCDESFMCNSDLEVHMRSHIGIDTDKLIKHKRFHTGKKPYKCDECGLRYTLRCNLTRHQHIHAGVKSHKCDECGLEFALRAYLKKHEITHTDVKPYKCEECGLRYKRREHLNKHKNTHTGERPYTCDECGLRYKQKSYLKIHKLIHTGAKPYKCDQCGLGFTRRDSLNLHKNAHTGEKPYKCDECGLQFPRRGQLHRHKLGHTGMGQFSCDECHKTFTQIAYLNKHKSRHTGEEPYKCGECGVGFVLMSDLNRHKLRHTGIDTVLL